MSRAHAVSIGPVHSDHLLTLRTVTSSVWHSVWHVALTSPWAAIVLMVPAVAVLIGCTRVTMRRS